jgi:hypothetical protein
MASAVARIENVRMTVYMAWTSADICELDPSRDLAGPWREVVLAGAGLPKAKGLRPGTNSWLRARLG